MDNFPWKLDTATTPEEIVDKEHDDPKKVD
jgi:hypothetical protein